MKDQIGSLRNGVSVTNPQPLKDWLVEQINRVTAPPPGEGPHWAHAMGYAQACLDVARRENLLSNDEQAAAIAAILAAGGHVS